MSQKQQPPLSNGLILIIVVVVVIALIGGIIIIALAMSPDSLRFAGLDQGSDQPLTATAPPDASLAPAPSDTPVTSLPATANAQQPTAVVSVATFVPTISPTSTLPLVDQAEFVADVTVPDGAGFIPAAKFVKTWRVKNIGTSIWTKDYVLEFVLGTNMAAANTVPFPGEVPPGQTVDLSIEMTAPTVPGPYTSMWRFRNPGGVLFGVGPNFNEVVYLKIEVIAGAASATPGSAPAASVTVAPTAPVVVVTLKPATVTKVTLSVDNANPTNSCPHTFVFTAIMEVDGGGIVKYQLEAISATEGFKFDLPAPIESTFTSNGPHTFGVSYSLEIRNTVSGEAWLHVLSPNELVSNKTPFSLTCPQSTTPPTLSLTPTP